MWQRAMSCAVFMHNSYEQQFWIIVSRDIRFHQFFLLHFCVNSEDFRHSEIHHKNL